MSDPLRMDIDIAAFRKELAKLSDAVAEEHLVTAATAGALIVQNAAKERAPKRTRTLSRSIHTETLESSRDKAEVAVGTDVVYAGIQEYGGVITPKQAKMLAWQDGGEWHFAHSVTIPPHPYLRPAMDENKEAIAKTIQAVLSQLIARANA